MKLQVRFTVDVDWCDEDLGPVKKGDPLADRIEASVAEAITNAIAYAQGEGHKHDMEDKISILADSEVVAKLI
jgi:anti-sigma regulatory factor (Ser/Thr protein kinase)